VETLRATRERAGLTQTELAVLSGVAQPNIAAYESGRRPLSPRMRERLTDAMTRPSARVARHRDAVREIVTRNRGREPRLFGSVARGEDRPGSDLDLLVDLDDSASLFDLARMHLELEELLGIRVDVLDAQGLRDKHRGILDDAVPL
jgi:predicted nucleotidyltransferase